MKGPLRTFESIFREENLIFVRSRYVHRVTGEKIPLETLFLKKYFLGRLKDFFHVSICSEFPIVILYRV